MCVQFTNQENLASLTIKCDEDDFRLNLIYQQLSNYQIYQINYQITGQASIKSR